MLTIKDGLHYKLSQLARDDGLHLLLPAGIGDVAWALAKLLTVIREREAAGQTVTVWLPDGEQHRAGDYLRMLDVKHDYLPGWSTRACWDRPDQPPIPDHGWFSTHANRTLEEGRRLETYYPDLPLIYPRPRIKARDSATGPFVCLFAGTRGYMSGQLPAAYWRGIAERLSKRVAPVRWIGAGADVEFLEEIAPIHKFDGHLIDRPLDEVLAAVTSPLCRGLVGVASGVTISATVAGCRVWLAYPSHLDKMPGSWEQPGAVWDWSYVAELPGKVANGEVERFLRQKTPRGHHGS